jgi:hypothetical protein
MKILGSYGIMAEKAKRRRGRIPGLPISALKNLYVKCMIL